MSGMMLNIVGATFAAPVPIIGSAFGGGFFAGQISTAGNGIADYNLVVGPKASADRPNNPPPFNQFKIANTNDAGATSVIDGPSNSASMNDASHPAAEFCEGLTIGGFSDWYLPAKNELEVCYYNLKPGTANNRTTSGINPNAVPARASNYTTGTPAQTSATDFTNTSGTEFFGSNRYWTSTQASATYGYAQHFNDGFQMNYIPKNNYSQRIRAIRRVAV
jgi:hypothetical protein